MELTENDRKALNEKLSNPEKVVKCPRCGKELEYMRVGNSESVRCKTPNCIQKSLRGL